MQAVPKLDGCTGSYQNAFYSGRKSPQNISGALNMIFLSSVPTVGRSPRFRALYDIAIPCGQKIS